MSCTNLPAYCFYKIFDPEPPKAMTFDRHYLLYSAQGGIRLEAEDRYWILPPSRAAWIPAGTNIKIEIIHRVTCCSILYDTDFINSNISHCRVLAMPTFAREMVLHTQRWGPDQEALSNHAKQFFLTLSGVCSELAQEPSEVWVPKGKTEPMKRALEFTQNHLGDKNSFAEVASASCLSERSLTRIFTQETGMTWGQMQRRMRMIRAMELLGTSDDQIANVALDVGYDSLSAFNRAFKEFSKVTPSEFRSRLDT
ncbi:MAG: AraC family transcriptional regulator [Halopseudomonas aestusnigri]